MATATANFAILSDAVVRYDRRMCNPWQCGTRQCDGHRSERDARACAAWAVADLLAPPSAMPANRLPPRELARHLARKGVSLSWDR